MCIHRPRAQVSVVGAQAAIRIGGEREPYRWFFPTTLLAGAWARGLFARSLETKDTQKGRFL
jgi:hypothetical protein